MLTPQEAAEQIILATPRACDNINAFTREVFGVRGGRMGSGMGTLLEALWGYFINSTLKGGGVACEIGWLPDNEYNDFACIQRDEPWEPATRTGEILRIETKSMNAGAEESKAHFDELIQNLGDFDLLMVLVWSWKPLDGFRVFPMIHDHFIGQARAVATLRDSLHLARGGTFVDRNTCPDSCPPTRCEHDGEPLNASGKRERLSGPATCRVSRDVSYAANFGGLVRMLKTSSPAARNTLRKARARDDIAHEYISFIHRNYPDEERNQYQAVEWRQLAEQMGISTKGLTTEEIIANVRMAKPDYREHLRGFV